MGKSKVAAVLMILAVCSAAFGQSATKHNVIIFVADGLRHGSVNAVDTPALWRVRTEGVHFRNSHSVFPTFTTANASVIATGHGLGDTGDFSNTIYVGYQQRVAASVVPFLEDDEVLRDLNQHEGGNYLGERTLLGLASEQGYSVASVGKLGPTAIQQNELVFAGESASRAIILDDQTGRPHGIPLSESLAAMLTKAGLGTQAPDRSNGADKQSPENNGNSGSAIRKGTKQANLTQEQWFADATTQGILPQFASSGKPFVLLFWSRDPDGTQHNEGDSLQKTSPGINGPTVTLGLRNADHCLQQLLDWLDAHPTIKDVTDVFVTSDHGFATISRREIAADRKTAAEAARHTYAVRPSEEGPEPAGTLPSGFLAVDLAVGLKTNLFDPSVTADDKSGSVYKRLILNSTTFEHPANGSGLLGNAVAKLDGSDADAIVAANGGSDLIYVPNEQISTVKRIVNLLSTFDYVGSIFVDDKYGRLPGALPLSSIGLVGKTKLPRPAIVVAFKVFYLHPGDLQSAIQVSDTSLQEGQGMHGGLGRDSTFNNMAAIGPDFKKGFSDDLPVGNIDIAPTLEAILGLNVQPNGNLRGRVLSEALADRKKSVATLKTSHLVSQPAANGKRTVLDYQDFEHVRYVDRGCVNSVGAQCGGVEH
jgi:arylsulfatase A-like enzyme